MMSRGEFINIKRGRYDGDCHYDEDGNECAELIEVMAEIIRAQNKIIRNAMDEAGNPQVSFEFGAMDWRYGFVSDGYHELVEEILPQLPEDWLDHEDPTDG